MKAPTCVQDSFGVAALSAVVGDVLEGLRAAMRNPRALQRLLVARASGPEVRLVERACGLSEARK
eukprot:scaffold301_cov243-Pinguiococcus_pyrenoidosus.AAC.79